MVDIRKYRGLVWFAGGLKRAGRDEKGVAAVEFGLIAPVLLLMLVGTIEVSRAVSMDRRFGTVTSMVADLVAREKTITSGDVNSIYDIVAHIMRPWDASSLKIEIIPVKASPSDAGNTKVYAGTVNRPTRGGAAQKAKCQPYTMSNGLLTAGASAIVVESSYVYVPLLTRSIFTGSTWTDRAILNPRNACVDFDGDNCVSTCF